MSQSAHSGASGVPLSPPEHDPTLFPAESGSYTKIWDLLYTGHYATGGNSVGAPDFPGWNALILAIYHNGSQFTTSGFNYDYDQVIFSKAPITAPTRQALVRSEPSTALNEATRR